MSSYYEKIGGNVRCIDEEIPFEVPDNWEWVRLGNAIELYSGRDLLPQSYNDNNEGIPYVTGASNICEENIIVNRWTKNPVVLSTKGDLLITCKGTVGAMAFNTLGNVHIARQIMAIRALYVDIEYIRIFLLWYMPNLIQQAKSMIPGISRENILDAIIPLPPINEQYTIRNQLEIIDSLLSKYDKLEQETEKLDIQLPELLKKSILQSAIQGKLVAQNPDDEPASILLEKIRKEKEQLIKAGKLKRDKNESFIYKNTADNSYYEKIGGETRCIDDEVLFEVPDNWEWVRLKNIIQINPTNRADDNINASFVTMKDIEAGYSNSFTFEEKEWGNIKKGFTHFQNGDVAFAKITPCFQNRKSLIFNDLINNIGAGTTELHILRPIAEYTDPFYLLIFVKTEYFIKYGITNFTGTAGQQRFPTDKLKDILIPLPPNYEQKRISEKVKLLFALFH